MECEICRFPFCHLHTTSVIRLISVPFQAGLPQPYAHVTAFTRPIFVLHRWSIARCGKPAKGLTAHETARRLRLLTAQEAQCLQLEIAACWWLFEYHSWLLEKLSVQSHRRRTLVVPFPFNSCFIECRSLFPSANKQYLFLFKRNGTETSPFLSLLMHCNLNVMNERWN